MTKAIRIRFLILVFLLVVTLCSFFPSNIFLLIVSALFLIIITKKIIINTKINYSNMTKIVSGKKLWNYDNLEPAERKGAI